MSSLQIYRLGGLPYSEQWVNSRFYTPQGQTVAKPEILNIPITPTPIPAPRGRYINIFRCYNPFLMSIYQCHFSRNSISTRIYEIIHVITKRSLQNIAHVMTAVVSWHLHNFLMISWIRINDISPRFEMQERKCLMEIYVNKPLGTEVTVIFNDLGRYF